MNHTACDWLLIIYCIFIDWHMRLNKTDELRFLLSVHLSCSKDRFSVLMTWSRGSPDKSEIIKKTNTNTKRLNVLLLELVDVNNLKSDLSRQAGACPEGGWVANPEVPLSWSMIGCLPSRRRSLVQTSILDVYCFILLLKVLFVSRT